MFIEKSKRVVLQIVSIAIFSVGLAPASFAGAIDTSYMVDAGSRTSSLNRIQDIFAQENIAELLEKYGVEQSAIDERLQGMTTAELASLEQRLEHDVAGGDLIAIVGVTFIVLLILELVGVTDIFKSF